MGKVKLPREVSEAINRHKHMGMVAIMGAIARWNDIETVTPELRIMRDYYWENPYLFAEAIINGYEVEETPEEKAADYITRLRNMRDHTYTDPAQQRELNIEVSGAIQVLEYLNIKIKGVNDNE